MNSTRYRDFSSVLTRLGLQPGEDYGAAEECHTHISTHNHKGKEYEVYFDELAGPFSQWKAFAQGIGTKSGLEREDVICAMQEAIEAI